jgi:two-component system, LuxR family, sensor kinase FixL
MIRRVLQWDQRAIFAYAALLVVATAVADWRIEINATLGFLYIFPMILLGMVAPWWQIAIAAVFCTALSDRLDPFPMEMESARDILICLTLAITGLLSLSVTKSYRREMESVAARRAAEQQLEFLIESSPAAVLTMTGEGEILLANPAAHRLLGVGENLLPGQRIARFVPALASVPAVDETEKVFRTEMQTRGQKESGEVFLANVFFSTYSTPVGPRLSALLVDASEHLREREEASLEQLLAGSRILVAAVSHEVRNVCGAIGMMHENLARSGSLKGNQDFEALGSLVQTLSKIASLELKQSAGSAEPSVTDLNDVLSDLRSVLGPICEESDIELRWNVLDNLPLVQADRHSLFQVLLNLTKNSQRALEGAQEKVIEISVAPRPGGIAIRFADSGPGIPAGQRLFQPLQKGADATGLGLYLSRAFMRSFRGDLRHDPQHAGCCFVLELAIGAEAGDQESSAAEDAAHTTSTT